MKHFKFDVVIIGSGSAGVTAAGALAGAGISVALLEAGVYAGAENWSGCVYFTENLAAADCFGPEAVEAAPYERKVVRRGTLIHNGLDEVGVALTDAEAFKNCYTVLRPVYDPYFAHLAELKGAVHLTETTVTSLIRKQGRVIGVNTNRGPLYADFTFIAEGDASHLIRSEGLEKVTAPHYLQGVKAVLSLPSEEIEKRFLLGQGQGAAFEILIRNAAIAGRTAKLNVGGFLYTNKDSLSLGYVLPLDNLRNNYRGSHDQLFEWMRSLPYIKELTQGATFSAYGTKVIRSGGWRERPVLVEDGLVVGGASAGLGIDIPFPNFTGPASATGLYFSRAVKNILKRGGSPDAKNLTREYLTPLRESVYGKNAGYLSRWPGYFGRSKVLFGGTTDIACGLPHFLVQASLADAGRFLRAHLTPRALRELIADALAAIKSLRLWKPVLRSLFNPKTISRWFLNMLKPAALQDDKLKIILNIGGKKIDVNSFPQPLRGLIKRMSPAVGRSLSVVYANDNKTMKRKLSEAVQILMESLRVTDFIILPLYALFLSLIAAATALWDAFRFYVLKTPVEKLLAEPVMAYNDAQRKARDLDGIKPAMSLEAKLATNTYRVGSRSHIRTLWPEAVMSHPDMSQAGLWWVCPARVYVYDTPSLAGRGKVTVNFENCIKCESCWRAEPARALWGRFTDHKLIYRPESGALQGLLESLKTAPQGNPATSLPETFDDKLWHLSDEIRRSSRGAVAASAAFLDSVEKLSPSADESRRAWPLSLGKRLNDRLAKLESSLSNDSRYEQAQTIQEERKHIELALSDGRFFHALYGCRRIEERLQSWIGAPARRASEPVTLTLGRNDRLSYNEVSRLFPDRIVKAWEDEPLPDAWAQKLRSFLSEHQDRSREAVRALSSISPALGLIAAHHFAAHKILSGSGVPSELDVCAVDGSLLEISEEGENIRIKGAFSLVPLAAARALLLLSPSGAHPVPLSSAGVTITRTPAIGFRAAGLSDISLSCLVKKNTISAQAEAQPLADSYLAVALGAADYLCTRVKEHASGRIQFPGQMLDTEGRDGIAKLGAVKALIARVEAWRLLLETLYSRSHPSLLPPHSSRELGLLSSTIASLAFGPEPGTLGYDAGQVFGGFAYSEDDLLSRFYRDSSLFRFLVPGYEAAKKLNAVLGTDAHPNALDMVKGEPLGQMSARLTSIARMCFSLPAQTDPVLGGEAKAIVLALRGLLTAVEAGLNDGRSMEAEAAAAEVMLGLAGDAVHTARLSAGRGKTSPSAVFPLEPVGKQAALEMSYEDFCAAPGAPHRSARFLAEAFDRSPRFVPEMQLHDAKLRTRWSELAHWFRENCRAKKFDGLDIERFIEKTHHLPSEVLQAVKDKKWLATYIPRSEDGLGWHKAEYYILNSVAGSFGDASIDLLIMASTSIGTTPILLGLEEELPRVREELAPLAQDERKLGEINERLGKIIATLSNPNPAWIRKEYEAVMKLVDGRIRRTRVVKYLAANFLRAFYGAGIAGRRGDFGGFMANLRHGGELFAKLMPDVRAALEELPRRERCHRLFLRYLGHGAVSAFALTEPTAGSDSGGVKTTARLQSARLTSLEDGRYAFYLEEGNEQSIRYLIDMDRIAFAGGVAYQTPDGQTVPVKYDRYDYATDQGTRYYAYKGRECPFHDIGQVRKSGSELRYEYYSLTGAKMWITNGSIATQFCLYAQSPEGVTGFMVDRHAEGLKVGADEKKTGQRGSPTNEISIDSVRVPREAVIGYEGHGQVNALETLNVGRCGLAVVSGALMRKLMQEAAATVPQSPERDRLLGEAAAVLFGSESLAYYLVGLFDRPHESVRMESAIAKYACSEDIHELLSLVEYAFGPAGQTEKYLLEKARRDSRILTIYEGTNEVQRFLILKDLIALAASWPAISDEQLDGPAKTLAGWKNRLRKNVGDVAALLGDTAWTDAMLQPALFPLAEMAGELLRLECVYYRKEWLEARAPVLSQSHAGYVPAMLSAADRAADRTIMRLEQLGEKFASAWEQVKGNRDMPEVRAADAALDRMADKSVPARFSPEALRAPVRVLVIVRPVADLSPRPRFFDDQVRELIWRIDPSDQAALAQALDLKAGSDAAVTVDVLMPGGVEHEELLRTAAGSLVDRLHRLAVDPAAPSSLYWQSVRDLESALSYDLILTGAGCLSGDQALGASLAGNLKRHHYRRERIEVKPDGTGFSRLALPAVVSITDKAGERLMNMTEVLSSSFSRIRVLEPAEQLSDSQPRFVLPAATAGLSATITGTKQAALYLKSFASSASASEAPEYKGEPVPGKLEDGDAVWAILDPQEQRSNLAALRAVRYVADHLGKRAHALVAAPRGMWPRLLGLAEASGSEKAFCVDTKDGRLSNDGRRGLIRALLKPSGRAFIFAGSEWSGSFAYVAGELETGRGEILLSSGATAIRQDKTGSLVLVLPVYEGKLLREQSIKEKSAFITIAPEADLPAPAKRADFKAILLDFAIAPDHIMPLSPVAAPTLSQADLIIDLGYGIRDRSGLELAKELKRKLEALGLAPMFGATRKVTQDLKLQPLEAQIGQTGVRVNPRLIIALGISGAPQHIDYIGSRAEVLCFNKDVEAPLMKLNQTRTAPRVHPIAGDLFVTVRELIDQLG